MTNMADGARSFAWVALALWSSGCQTQSNVATADDAARHAAGDAIDSEAPVLAIAFSDDSCSFARLCDNGVVYIADLVRGETIGSQSTTKPVRAVLDFASLAHFAVAAPDGVQVWSSEPALQLNLPNPSGPVAFVRIDESSGHMLIAGENGVATVVDVSTGATVATAAPKPGEVGLSILPGTGLDVVYLVDANRARVVTLTPEPAERTMVIPRDPKRPTVISGDGSVIAAFGRNGSVHVTSLKDGALLSSISGFDSTPASVALSPDGSVLAVLDGDGVELWDVARRCRLDQTASTVWRDGVATFSPDGFTLAWIAGDGTRVRLWSLARGLVRRTDGGTVIEPAAEAVCTDLAMMIRYRLATVPFQRGRQEFERGKLTESKHEFARVGELFPEYPGLATAIREVEERVQAIARVARISAQVEKLEHAGLFRKALEVLDEFLKGGATYGDSGHRERAGILRAALGHRDAAELFRKEGKDIDAVLEFEKAVAIVPELAAKHPEFTASRQQLVGNLIATGEQAFKAKSDRGLLLAYGQLKRLRPLEVEWLLRVGGAHERLGDRKKADVAYTAIPDSAPEFVDARRRMARAAIRAGELGRARTELEQARRVAPRRADLEREYAGVCRSMQDFDSAVATWRRIGEISADDPEPFETIAEIEKGREHWAVAARALRRAIERSKEPRPQLLVEVGAMHKAAGDAAAVLDAYVDLLALVDRGVEIRELGARPRTRVLTMIRELGFVRRRSEWITKDAFFEEQGWVRYRNTWLRPDELRLRQVSDRLQEQGAAELRTSSEKEYKSEATERRVSKGMNRREVILAWGYFKDQNVLTIDAETVYEQFLYDNGRRVILRNGLVCSWSE